MGKQDHTGRAAFGERTISLLVMLPLLIFAHPAVFAAAEGSAPPSGNGLQSTWVEDNPGCADLGYDRSSRPQPELP
jgi:hypothetical protein